MCTAAHTVRAEDTDSPGWRGYAASFDDFALKRDDLIPLGIARLSPTRNSPEHEVGPAVKEPSARAFFRSRLPFKFGRICGL